MFEYDLGTCVGAIQSGAALPTGKRGHFPIAPFDTEFSSVGVVRFQDQDLGGIQLSVCCLSVFPVLVREKGGMK